MARITSKVTMSGEFPDVFELTDGVQAYREGISDVSSVDAHDLFLNIIEPLRIAVHSYRDEFNVAVNDYMMSNNLLRQMRDTLSPSQRARTDTVEINKKKLNNGKKATKNLIATMEKGHSLLLRMRESLTGQQISTKFMIAHGGKVYLIDEANVPTKLVLSQFGGGTVSNPFSLAYQIDVELMKNREFLEKAEEISTTDIWQQIYNLKRPYLDEKSKITGKKYPNIFYDSKDAEIYELYAQQKKTDLTLSDYSSLRASMGGGGGYASPFYKIGDVGSIQVKYFNLKKGTRNSTVNFARFSLLRDRFRELEEILSKNDIQEIGQSLMEFFTEKETNISQTVTQDVNNLAKKEFAQLFGLLT